VAFENWEKFVYETTRQLKQDKQRNKAKKQRNKETKQKGLPDQQQEGRT